MDNANICKEVGAKIRYFRKLQGHTLASFSALLHRSRSVLSQYERGEIAVDLLTLQQISHALNIPLGALVDNFWDAGSPFISEEAGVISAENARHEYIYTYFSHAKVPVLRVHLLCYNESKTRAILYTYPSEKVNGSSFEYCYSGQIVSGQSFMRLLLTNPLIEDDLLLFEFPMRFRNAGVVAGFLSSYSVGAYFPLAATALLSNAPITDRDLLISCLTYSREDVKMNKQYNCFFVSQDKDHSVYRKMETHKNSNKTY